jgi:alpha-tubulin suppressor-like RCC1 family protein
MFHRLRPLRRPLATIAAGGTAFVASQLIDNRPALSAQKPAPAPKLFCWGRLVPSDAAQVPYRAREPVDVDFWASRGARVAQICYGDDHGAALDDRGALWVWGGDAGPLPRRLPCRASVRAIASSSSALYAVTSRGHVLEWADLGARLKPNAALPPEPSPLGGDLARVTATAVAAGGAHALAVGKNGELCAWGDNSHGQLGLGAAGAAAVASPTLVGALPSPAAAAACGGGHSVVALRDGSCVAFGDDRNLQLGVRPATVKALRDGAPAVATPTTVRLPAGKRAVAVAAGGGGLEGGHTAFVLRDAAAGDGAADELWACGHGRWGQLGLKAYTHVSEPKALSALRGLVEYDEAAGRVKPIRIDGLACGERHTAALLSTGNVFTWGWNDDGQLGASSGGGGSGGSNAKPTMLTRPKELRWGRMTGIACGPTSTAVWGDAGAPENLL